MSEPKVSPEHPLHPLVFYIEGSVADHDIVAMEAFLVRLADTRSWTLGPPQFVNEDEEPPSNPVDTPLRIVGGVFELYSSYPPWKDRLPVAVNRAQFEETTDIIEKLADFSLKRDLSIGIEFNEEHIGSIERGKVEDSIREGLLGAWRKELESLGGFRV